MPVEIHVRTTGPVVEGRAGPIITAALSDFAHEVGQEALGETLMNLDGSIRNPTPYYETQVVNDRRADDWVVNDRGVIYGPWLEGTSSRNRTTRFKGYASFRRAADAVRPRVPAIVDRVLDQLVRRLS